MDSPKKSLYKQGIELISKNIGINKPDLEIHLNVWSTSNDPWPKFAILNETKYIHPDNFNLKLLKKYSKVFSWDKNLIDIGLATKIQLAHPLGEGIVDGYKNRDQFIEFCLVLIELLEVGILNLTYIAKELKLLDGSKIMLQMIFHFMEKNGTYQLGYLLVLVLLYIVLKKECLLEKFHFVLGKVPF